MTEYGVLFSHASERVYADLIGPTYPELAAATSWAGKVARAQGVKYRTVVRFAPGQEWQTIGDKLTPRQALSAGIESGFRHWM